MRLRLTRKFAEAGNAKSFRFRPERPLSWQAGQYLKYTLPHEHPDDQGTSRYFTIASAPYEGEVQITTRISQSSFKRALDALEPDDGIEAEGPSGDFAWREAEVPHSWIAAGIGITPFHSILAERIHRGLPLPVRLLYANRDEKVIFRETLEAWAGARAAFELQFVISERLGAELIRERLGGLERGLVYLSGPEPMVEAIGAALIDTGLDEDRLQRDWFPGYTETTY